MLDGLGEISCFFFPFFVNSFRIGEIKAATQEQTSQLTCEFYSITISLYYKVGRGVKKNRIETKPIGQWNDKHLLTDRHCRGRCCFQQTSFFFFFFKRKLGKWPIGDARSADPIRPRACVDRPVFPWAVAVGAASSPFSFHNVITIFTWSMGR